MKDFKIYLNFFKDFYIEISPFEWQIIPFWGSSHLYYNDNVWLNRKDRGSSDYAGDNLEVRYRKECKQFWFSVLIFTFKLNLEILTIWGKQFPKNYQSIEETY